MAAATGSVVDTWLKKRIPAASRLHKKWKEDNKVQECYNYWRGEQLDNPLDEFGQPRAQINKIHPEVRNNIPSLYYYRPFARLSALPEQIEDPGSQVEEDTQLLQDTVNALIRDKQTQFRESTFIALKESHWAYGVCEVGYTAEFVDAPNADRPPLKEKKDTKVQTAPKLAPPPPEMGMPAPEMGMPVDPMAPPVDPMSTMLDPMASMAQPIDPNQAAIEAEIQALQEQLKSERFFVKHIPANNILVSTSDMPILENNDWIGYWEDMNLEDVKASKAYKNAKDLKANTGEADQFAQKNAEDANEAEGAADKIRLYRIWDLRTRERIVLAEGHDKELLRKPFSRVPLKFLRFDIDPYHFYPRPLLLSKLGPQDEYNDSREYLRKIRKGTVPRYTYDEDAIDADQLKKLESGEMGTYVPRKPGTSNVIEPVNQPSFSENAIQTLTLSDKEFSDVGGVGGDAKIAQSKTATQAKISETKNQVQDSFDRLMVADWLGEICRELLCLAVENMSMDRAIATNVTPDNMYYNEIGQKVTQSFKRINATILSDAAAGVSWDVIIDLEALSPVSEEEKFQKWMQGLSLFGNPVFARMFAVSPEILKHTLTLLGIKSGRDVALIQDAMMKVVQMEAQLAAMGQNAAPGVSPQGGSGAPGQPKGPSGPTGPPPGGPQPGGPPGPGASLPSPPQ